MARVLQISVLVLLGCLVLALGIGDAFAAERRIALVIGNSKYKDTNISPLVDCVRWSWMARGREPFLAQR